MTTIPRILALLLLGAAQEGELDRILAGHEQRMRAARTPGDARRILEETRGRLDAFVAAHPRHADAPRAAWHACESLLATGEHAKGLDRLRALVRDHPDAPAASNARFAIGEALLDLEDWAGAREAAAEFLRRHPKDERAFFAKALSAAAHAGEGRYDPAVDALRAARDEHRDRPDSWGALLQVAAFRHAQEKNDDARRALEEAIQGCPDPETKDVARLHLSAYLKIGRERPAFAGKDLRGAEAGAATLAGKVGLVYFFDSTLEAAVGELRALKRLREKLGPSGLAIVGVSVDLERREAVQIESQEQPGWPLLWDGKGYDGEAARAFDVRRLPSLWVCDRQGRLRFHNLAGPDLRRAVSGLLQEK